MHNELACTAFYLLCKGVGQCAKSMGHNELAYTVQSESTCTQCIEFAIKIIFLVLCSQLKGTLFAHQNSINIFIAYLTRWAIFVYILDRHNSSEPISPTCISYIVSAAGDMDLTDCRNMCCCTRQRTRGRNRRLSCKVFSVASTWSYST